MLKLSREFTEFTIRVEKDWYETWSAIMEIKSDMELTVPMVMLGTTTVTDIDGNVYKTVKIGDQWWMAKNLRVSRYRNGDKIPTDLSNSEWEDADYGASAIYLHSQIEGLNSAEEVEAAYGKLYNWYAVDDDRGLCPEGWHVPSREEWTELTEYLGGWDVARGKMKCTRTEPDPHPRWKNPNTGATNESGFSGLPGGIRNAFGYYGGIGEIGYWWRSTKVSEIYLFYEDAIVDRFDISKRDGFSVRCLRDD